ncbi:MAG: zinc-binding dehydrogenase, partial [Gemmataceae bacterium]
HEAVGRIVAVGPGTLLPVGRRVVWAVAASCSRCFYCTHHLPQKCEAVQKYGHARHAEEGHRGPAGSMASHVHTWPGTALVPIPDDLPAETAAPAACATATVMAALDPVASAETVVVLGAGMLGLTACAVLASRGIPRIIAIDQSESRLEVARRFGATETTTIIPKLDRGADVVLEFTGNADLTAAGLQSLRTGGVLVLVGAVFPGPSLALDPQQFIRRHWTLMGVHNYAPRHLSAAVGFLSGPGRLFAWPSLVPRVFPLDAWDEIVAFAAAEKPFRIGVQAVNYSP